MNVIYINQKQEVFKLDKNKEVVKLEKLSFKKDDIISSTLDLREVTTGIFKLPASAVDAEIETGLYSTLSIDKNKDYVKHYIKNIINQNQPELLVEALFIPEEELYETFAELLQTTKYIDYISFSMFAFEEFYPIYKFDPKIDVFVYLDLDQAFVVVLNEGKYVSSKSIKNGLREVLTKNQIDYKTFKDLISQNGLDTSKYEGEYFFLGAEIEQFFSNFFEEVKRRIEHIQLQFYLPNIDNLYFYTPFEIANSDNITYWKDFGIDFRIVEIENINLLDKLVTIYNSNHYADSEFNFSIFPRPPKFYKTQSFKLFSVVFATLLAFGGDFGYRYYQNQQLKQMLNTSQHKLIQKQQKLKKLEKLNKEILKELDNYQKQINNIQNQIFTIKQILKKTLILVNLDKTSNDFITFSNLLQKNHLKTFVIIKDEQNRFNIGVYTKYKNRKYIGLFMSDLMKNNYHNVKTNKITAVEGDYYLSLIRLTK